MAQVRLCLVINKMDRLILELGLSPQEAYTRLKGIITHVNMIVSAFQSEQHISEADAVLAHQDAMATLDDRCFPFLATQALWATSLAGCTCETVSTLLRQAEEQINPEDLNSLGTMLTM